MSRVYSRVYFEEPESGIISNVREEITERLGEGRWIDSVTSVDVSDFCVYFCPIVSRQGTDIEEKRRKIKGDKPAIVVVLHHKLRPGAVPDSSQYDMPNRNIIFLDFLFSEDAGLLLCEKNEDSFCKAGQHMERHGIQRVFPTGNEPQMLSSCWRQNYWLWVVLCVLVISLIIFLSVYFTRV